MSVAFGGEKKQIKHFFKCIFRDGSIMEQTPEDVSVVDPSRNCFYDVMQEEEKRGGIKEFILEGQGHKYVVNLIDGHFQIDDGTVFYLHDGNDMGCAPIDCKLKLVQFRRRQEHQDITYSLSTGAVRQLGEHRSTAQQFLGWQTNINGKNFKHTIHFEI